MDQTVEKYAHELARLRECEAAWYAVYEALHAHSPALFSSPGNGTGKQRAVAEIKRLQENDK